MTPSAPAFAIARTWAGFEPRTRRRPAPARPPSPRGRGVATVGGSDVRAPVTPTSDTQYRNPPLRAATAARRSGAVVGATR